MKCIVLAVTFFVSSNLLIGSSLAERILVIDRILDSSREELLATFQQSTTVGKSMSSLLSIESSEGFSGKNTLKLELHNLLTERIRRSVSSAFTHEELIEMERIHSSGLKGRSVVLKLLCFTVDSDFELINKVGDMLLSNTDPTRQPVSGNDAN